MPKRKSNHIVFLTIVCSFLFATACTNRPKEVLNPNKMVKVLTDLHKLDGIIAAEGMEYTEINALYYEHILEKHNINQAIFDSSLVWYTRNPKRFEKVYIKVVENVTDWENEILGGKYHPIELDTVEILTFAFSNLWHLPITYQLNGDSARTELAFEIENDSLLLGDIYILSFLHRIAPEDSTSDRRAMLYINYLNGKSDTLSTALHNDSLLRRFTFYKYVNDSLKIKSVAGKLLAGSDYKGTQHVFIDSVSLIRRYSPSMQDSLRIIVDVNDTTKIDVKELTDSITQKKMDLIIDSTQIQPAILLKKPVFERTRFQIQNK